MRYVSEIYLNKKDITSSDWMQFLESISKYFKIFNIWNIIVKISGNNIRYFIESNIELPITLNNNASFLLKKSDDIKIPLIHGTYFLLTKPDDNIIDFYDKCKIEKKGDLKYIKIFFKKVSYKKIISKTNLYVDKEDKYKKYRLVFNCPSEILAVNFKINNRFLYKSTPKYLDISKCFHLLKSDSLCSSLKADTFPYLIGDYYINMNDYSFDKHSLILGASGSGKSKFISSFIANIQKNSDLSQKYKVVIIDPHASLEHDIGGLGRVIDFKSIQQSIDLFINNVNDVISSTELLLDLFKSLINDQYNPKLERVLRHAIYLLLIAKQFNFHDLRTLILDLEYRTNLIRKFEDELPISVVDFFLADFNDLKTNSYSQAISPIISFIDEMEMIPVFNEKNISDTLEGVINKNFLTIFSLDMVKLGNKVTKTISGLIMQQLFTLIENYSFDSHILFVVDEVAVIENPILLRFLAEARKYNLSLILAGQYFSQVSSSLKSAIFANIVNYYIFRVSKMDADNLIDNFSIKIPLDDSRDRKVKLLTDLNNRECIVRIQANEFLLPAIKCSTTDFISIPYIREKCDKEENKELEIKNNNFSFQINSNINMHDILTLNSTRGEINE